MTDEEKAALEKERDDAKKRADSAEAELKSEREDRAKKDSERESEREAKERDDKAKKDAEEAEAKEKVDAAKRDSRKDRHAKHDGEVMDCAKCDSEEKAEEKEREDKAKKDAAKEAEPEAGRGTEIHDSAKIASMEKQIAELQRANRPLTLEESDQLSRSYHRFNGLFQMLMDNSPQPMPGEMPVAFRRRAVNALRKYTQSFQNYAFHDSQQLKDFELVENAIIEEATRYAKNPPADQMAGQVREIKDSTTLPGKVITSFVGDAKAVWAPFVSPVRRFLKKVNTQPRGAAF